jgi:hypothetical protein
MQYLPRMQKCTLLGLLVLLGSGCSSSGSGGNGGSATDASASDSSVADAGGASNDASSPNDASDASQSEASEDGSDGLLTCATSLTSACASAPAGYECPPSTESALPGTWCSSHPGAGALLGACGGYTALLETFIGTELVYLYALDGGALSAIVNVGSPTACAGGAPGFAIPASCFGTGALTATFDGPGAETGCAIDAGVSDGGDAGSAGDGGDADAAGDGGDGG